MSVGFEEIGEGGPVVIGVVFGAWVEEGGGGEGIVGGRRVGLGLGRKWLGVRDGVDRWRESGGEIAEDEGWVFDIGVGVEGVRCGEKGIGG